jgi:uncharacterized repeat protein (TIGR03803 family)
MARLFHRALLRAAIIIGLITPALAQNLTTLYAFPSFGSGNSPRGGLAMDNAGALYGTTQYGGMYQGNVCGNCSTIYKLLPPAAGQTAWTYQLLHMMTFDPIQGYSEDGFAPTAPLTNFQNVLYGTNSVGGDTQCGCGNIFSITPAGVYAILHVFDPLTGGAPNGTTPNGGLLIDTDGTIYGTMSGGGANRSGTIYKISTTGSGFTILHSFVGNSTSGPMGELIFGQDGAIYGTTFGGGQNNKGAIFRMNRTAATIRCCTTSRAWASWAMGTMAPIPKAASPLPATERSTAPRHSAAAVRPSTAPLGRSSKTGRAGLTRSFLFSAAPETSRTAA